MDPKYRSTEKHKKYIKIKICFDPLHCACVSSTNGTNGAIAYLITIKCVILTITTAALAKCAVEINKE